MNDSVRSPSNPRRLALHGWVGISLMAGMQAFLLIRRFAPSVMPSNVLDAVTMFATPVCWWGYILLLDAWILRRTGKSWIFHRSRFFALQLIFSFAFWVLFEGYNVLMKNWIYINLTPSYRLRYFGYILAFTTIMPGMFLTADLLQSFGPFRRLETPRKAVRLPSMRAVCWIGAAFCIIPPFLPGHISVYLFGFVWAGYVLWLDPINRARGARSLFADWEKGLWKTTLSLLAAGAVCGLLWEFWNFWAFTKWVYIFPILQKVKIFEMPVLGFFGFPPFALEYFVMYHYIESFFTTEDTLGL